MNPGGKKQYPFRNGWFINISNQEKVSQCMLIEEGDMKGQSKGLKQILQERGKYRQGMRLQCHGEASTDDLILCCARHTIAKEPDFMEQVFIPRSNY